MNSTVWKDNLREIKQSFPRFLSIFAIIGLGVAFFIGIKATGPAMTQTAVQYFDNYQLPDGIILSTSGINQSDLDILAEQNGVSWLPMKSFNSALKPGTETAKIYTYKPGDSQHFFNIVEGHLPEASNEIALDTLLMNQLNEEGETFQLGDVVTLEQPSNYEETTADDASSSDSDSSSVEDNTLTIEAPHFLETEYTVVGFVETPLYFERISRGPGTVSTFAVVPEENVAGDIYTEVYYWVDEARDYEAYTEEYDALALDKKVAIEESLNGQPLARLNEMRRDLTELLRDGRKEIADAYAEISNGHRLLSEGRQTLDAGWLDYYDGQTDLVEGQIQVFEGQQELDDSQQRIQAGWLEIATTQQLLLDNELTYQVGLAEYTNGLRAFEEGIALGEAEIIAGEAELASAYSALETGRLELLDGQRQIDQGLAELAAGRQQLIDEISQQLPTGFDDPAAILAYLEDMGISVEDLVSQLEDELTELPQQLETLGQELTTLQAEITELEASHEALLVRQTELEALIEDQTTNRQKLQDKLDGQNRTLNSLVEEATSLEALLQATPPSLPGEVDPETGEEGTTIDNPDYLSLQTQLATIQGQLEQEKQLLAQIQIEVSQADTQLATSQSELDQVQADLVDTQTQIDTLRQAQIDKVSELEFVQNLWEDVDQEAVRAQIEELLASQEEIETQIEQLVEAIEQMQVAQAQLDAAQIEVDAGWVEYYNGLAQYETGLSQLEAGRIQLDNERMNGQTQLALAKQELDEGRLALDDGYAQLEEGRDSLQDGQALWLQGLAEVQVARQELQHGQRLAYEGYLDLLEGETEYVDNELKLSDETAAALVELDDAEADLATAEEELASLEGPVYYVNGRDNLQPYESLQENAEKLNVISNIFPVFFFAIAVLVTFTTVKRMGSEQRNYMGTMKQMGYPTYVILSKFVTYAGLASILGIIFGIFIGYRVFPPVIMNAYNMMYYLDEQVIVTSHSVNLLVSLIALSCAIIPAIVTPINILKTQPALLLQPEPPKSGKKIIFERITWLWNILSFKRKMTIRNLLRYKGRNSMTLFGVAGCTMLIVTGFGISDTISGIVDRQMNDIQTFNSMLYIDDQEEPDEVEAFMAELADSPSIEAFAPIYTEQLETNRTDVVNQAISVVVPLVDDAAFADFISLQRRSQPDESLALNEEGIILTERLAEHLSFEEGEVLELKNETEELFEFEVSAITEHYIGHTLYLTPKAYEAEFLKEPQANAFYIDYSDEADQRQVEQAFTNDERVLTLLNLETVAEQASQSLGSLDVITIVLIVSAAGLAFVVLYNLTNINIAERMRELSTIKVLGFYNNEVSMYIFEEILVLTSIGSIIGLGLGNLLTSFLMKMMQPNNLLFHPIIHWDSYLISAGLTFVFSSIVMLFMHQKLRKIDMVEALKAVD